MAPSEALRNISTGVQRRVPAGQGRMYSFSYLICENQSSSKDDDRQGQTGGCLEEGSVEKGGCAKWA